MAASSKKVPPWLRWVLVVLILCNIMSYIGIAYFTIMEINDEIEEAKNNPKNDVPNGNDWHPSERETHSENYVEELEHRRPKIITGTVLEILLDIIDLINLFVENHCLHLVYGVLKMCSVGTWTLAQADLEITPLWFIPVGLTMLITIVVQEWFEEYRKWALVLLSSIASLAWCIILLIRIVQINRHVEQAKAKMETDDANRPKYDDFISALEANRTVVIIGSVLMLVVTLSGLTAIILAHFWFCLLIAVLLLIGNIFWVAKLLSDSQLVLNSLFMVPLVYSILIFLILLIFLYGLACNKFYGKQGRGNSNNKRNPKTRK